MIIPDYKNYKDSFTLMGSRLLLTLIGMVMLISRVQAWCEKTHFAETSRINEVDISPDRTMVVTSSNSNKMIVWNFTSLQPIFALNYGSTSVISSKFSKNQAYIAVGVSGPNVNIIQTSTWTSLTNISTGCTSVKEVDFSWDNTRLLICGSNAIETYWVGNWSREATLSNGGTPFTSCKFQKNNQFYGGDNVGKNNVYTLPNTLVWSDTQNNNAITDADFDMANWTVISTNGGGNKYLLYPSARWPTGGGTSQNLNKSVNYGSSTGSIDFAKDGSIYAVGVSSYVLIYENSTNNLLFNWTGTGTISSAVFSYDSQYYISGSSWGLLKVFKRMCQDCPSGTYQSSTGCPLCSSAMAGCLSCANSSYCYVCGDGYALDTVNKNCTLCHNTLPGCVLCNSTTICTACSSLYYLASNNCTSCSTIPGCVACNSSTTCVRCNLDFYLDSSFNCVSCAANCVSCLNSTACMSCNSGYYLNTTTLACSRCAQNCTLCYNSTTCSQCIDSYYLGSSKTCASCASNCLVCTSTACSRCVISYYASGSSCLPCSSAGTCFSCANASYCDTCAPGYYWSSGTCVACSGSCLTCTSSTACLSCNVNYYYLSASNTCNKCENLLAGCLQCTNTTCLLCESGSYYDGTNCLKCTISNGCQTCLNSTFCMSCISGYLFNSTTGACSACGVGCSSCSNSSVCINCLPKYYFSSGTCLLCPVNCPTCTSASACLSCIDGYYVTAGQICASCSVITNCASCTSNAYCTSCEVGYRLGPANTTCVKCAWPCSLCNATQCNQCATGYYLTAGVCTVCPITCSSCFSATQCTSCVDGFYLTATATCSTCQGVSAGCAACNQTSCFNCLSNLGYYLSSGSCSLCSSIANCLECKNSTFCTTCSFGYYINSGVCNGCSALTSNCQSCNGTACITCIDPFYLSGSACQLCAEGCSACYNGTVCKTCLTGYLLQTGVCTYCDTLINGCEVCTSTSVCTQCAEGYIISGTSCSSCHSLIPGCQYCNATNVCLTCMDQYYLNSNSCTKCDTMVGCSQCNSSSVCLVCETGFFQSASNACSQCADVMCSTCTNSTNCINCLSGYFVNSSGNCRQCSASWTGCVLCNSTQCLQCQSGYFVNSANQCSNCLVNGCEVCNTLLPTQCVTCSSLYYLSSNSCISCSLSMVGCISCVSSTQCLKCMVGSYLAANFTCQACFYLFKGCGECSATACTACQGGYAMNVTTCATCIAFIPGCLYCTSSSVCLSCQSGYYQTNNTCRSCGNITGCLDCSSATACNLCSDSYYLNTADNLCYLCDTLTSGCISCLSSGTCTACHGNYALSGGVCTVLKSESTQPYTQLRMVSQYVDKTHLRHRLIVNGKFNTKSSVNLTSNSNITMVGNSESVTLTIASFVWVSDFEVTFITNNPLGDNFNSFYKAMPSARLLSSNINLNYQFKLEMTETAIQSILPSSDHAGALSLSNPAENPSFIRSVYTTLPYNYHYFGLIMTLLMFVIYFVKAVVSVPQSDDQGELVSHIFLLRCGGVIFSLAYMEYIDYCYGFLSPDLPWLNIVTASMAASADLSPNSYLLFYENMTIASSYFTALCLLGGALLLMLLVGWRWQSKREGVKVLGMFLYNFFEVGLIMAGSMSIQGAYYNSLNYFTSNSVFYIVGILLFVGIGVVNVWMAVSSIHRINKVRVMVKTTFLSLLYVSPVYLLPIGLGVQLIFILAEYNIKKAVKLHPHVWLINQLLVNAALVSLVLLSNTMLSVLIPSIMVVTAFILDLFIHIREYRHQQQLVKVKEIQKLTTLMETQQKLNRTIKKRNNSIYENTRMNESGMGSSVFSQDIIFNPFDEDNVSSKSPFQSGKRKTATHIIEDVKEY